MLDVAELAIRWAAALGLAHVRAGHDGALPPTVTQSIRDHVERPTLGRWLAILRGLSATSGASSSAPVFSLYSDVLEALFASERSGATEMTSLLVARNHVAHGGGLSRQRAAALADAHAAGVKALIESVRDAADGWEPVATGDRGAHALMGPTPTAIDWPGGIPGGQAGAWLVRGDAAIPLWPLAEFGPVTLVSESGQLVQHEPRAKLYARSSPTRLSYTPVGSDHCVSESVDVSEFRALFRLDDPLAGPGGGAAHDFRAAIREARRRADELVGRRDELARIKAWLKARTPRDAETPRVGWLEGGPGIGKSLVMARIASDYGVQPHRGVFYHRFEAGTPTANRVAFLDALRWAVWDWPTLRAQTEAPDPAVLDAAALEADVLERLTGLEALEPSHPRAPAPSFWILMDGLDEVAASDPEIVALALRLAVSGVVVLLAGRDEYGVGAALREHANAEPIFEAGLPPMRPDDVRAMLVEGLGAARYALLGRDVDRDAGVSNAFVDAVTARAAGLPIYVQLVLEDLRAERMTVHDEARLPPGLEAYYEALTRRMGLSDVSHVLTTVIALLATSAEPVDEAGMAAVVATRAGHAAAELEPVERALHAGRALLKPAEDAAGWTLYHQSFREFVLSSPLLAGTLARVRRTLLDLADEWRALEAPFHRLRGHLARHALRYATAWGDERGRVAATQRMVDFAWLIARVGDSPLDDVFDLERDYASVDIPQLSEWRAFVRENAHRLRSATRSWPPERILLQRAMEYGVTSEVTKAATQWLQQTRPGWFWIRRETVPEQAVSATGVRILGGHDRAVEGAAVLDDGRLLSWSHDGSLRLWDAESGACLDTLAGHRDSLCGVRVEGTQALSWADDGTVRVWDLQRAELLLTCSGHEGRVNGAVRGDGAIASWGDDGTSRIWDATTGAERHVIRIDGHFGPEKARGGMIRGGKLYLYCVGAPPIAVFDLDTGAELERLGPKGLYMGVAELRNGSLCAWESNALCVIDPRTGETTQLVEGMDLDLDFDAMMELDAMEEDSGPPPGALPRPDPLEIDLHGVVETEDGLLVTSSSFSEQRWVWDPGLGFPVRVFEEHEDGGIHPDPVAVGHRVLTFGNDGKLALLWDPRDGSLVARLEHGDPMGGAVPTLDGGLVTWGGKVIRVWGPDGSAGPRLTGHASSIKGCSLLPDGRLLSWSEDHTLRIWPLDRGDLGDAQDTSDEGEAARLTVPGYRLAETVHLDDGSMVTVSEAHDSSFDEPCSALHWWETESSAPQELAELEVKPYQIDVHRLQNRRLLVRAEEEAAVVTLPGPGEEFDSLDGINALDQKVSCALVRPDGRLVVGGPEGRLSCLDVSSHMSAVWATRQASGVTRLHLLSGDRLVACGEDRVLRVFGAEGDCLAELAGHEFDVKGVLEIPGHRLVSRDERSYTEPGVFRVWQLPAAGRRGGPLSVYSEHTDRLEGMAWLPGDRIVSWAGPWTVHVWDPKDGRMLEVLPRNRWLEEAPDAWYLAQMDRDEEQPKGCVFGSAFGVPTMSTVGGLVQARWVEDGFWWAGDLAEDGSLTAQQMGLGATPKERLRLYFDGERATIAEFAVAQPIWPRFTGKSE